MADPEVVVTEIWAYAGVRFSEERGFLADEWRSDDPAKAPMYSRVRSDAPARIIGGKYRLKMRQGGEGRRPVFIHRYVDNAERLEWAMQDTEARQALEAKLEEDRGLMVNPIDEAVAPLKALLKSRKTYAARKRLLAALIDHVMSAE